MQNKLKIDIEHFQKLLIEFQIKNPTDKPWQSDRDPYKIWLFEIIMQQTRMAQGLPYFYKIIKAFPTLQNLANATEDKLFELWKGLGYYSRARNLHFTANYIFHNLNGIFPNTYCELIKLKGVGEYTAAAIASFAFGESVAVLDGNVHRILSRIYGIEKTIQSVTDKKYFQSIANQLLIPNQSAKFNQAMMDLGSTICKPQNPDCNDCQFQELCIANIEKRVELLPPPKIRPELKERYFYCLFVENKGKLYLEKRTDKDIWQGLYQGIMQEGKEIDLDFWKVRNLDISEVHWSEIQTQLLSHQRIKMRFGALKVNEIDLIKSNFHTIKSIHNMAMPRIISRWWEKRTIN